MKIEVPNPVFDYDLEDGMTINLSDPRLPENLRRRLYEMGVEEFGEPEGGFDGIKVLTIEDSNKAYKNLRRTFDPLFRGNNRAKKVFDFLVEADSDDEYTNLENLNDFLANKPINAYVLVKLMSMVVEQESKSKSSLAAIKGHAETYELKKQAVEYWREYIDPKLSNPKAADLLKKIIPISHRKLVEYVAEAKRENIHSAR